MIREIEAARPQYLVMVLVSSSWLDWPGADTTLKEWGERYTRQFYERTGSVYIYPDHSDYVWGAASLVERKDTAFIMDVYQRKEKL
jgi:hypothetical protein